MGQRQSGNAKSPHVLLMGLDSAGKSTLLYRLQHGVIAGTSPTVGFNAGSVAVDKKNSLTVWDIGGQQQLRAYWSFYLDGCKALVFVVDSSDQNRMGEASKALKKILTDVRMMDIPLMVLANKMDLPNSMTIREVSTQLCLERYTGHSWEIQACSALSGMGLQEAFLSVAKLIKHS
ncbi:ADP-ribosylation factor-like protein 11 [Denticeps clupeoides]|uniref:ADP-ribosylation factor-like protein 14 n=1 Tax=Denticeps clupeoides TaxID=299321 RepID=A0AAY4CUB3_9TELE|nr:ADP-ribosylation factor-like protein 11 [Denticeps clupeoides]XP_028834677.1 ADP-ribosylation factor-like protein 11 [Denticeps clupeoides]